MTFVLQRPDSLTNDEDLYTLLEATKQEVIASGNPRLVSVTHSVDLMDPLFALEALAQPSDPTFFMTRPSAGFAVAAIGSASTFQPQGSQRFQETKDHIQALLAHAQILGQTQMPFSGPHFFAGFSFLGTEDPSVSQVFLPRWQVSRQGHRSVVVGNVLLDPSVDLDNLAMEWRQSVRRLQQLSQPHSPLVGSGSGLTLSTDLSAFRATVKTALEAIHQGQFAKVVLAHQAELICGQPIQILPTMDRLRRLYPDCYSFALHNGHGQHFIGSSPERLLSIQNQRFTIDALAGSAARGHTPAQDRELGQQLLHSPKDRQEHQLVVDSIQERLQNLELSGIQSHPAHLLKLSNIQHLQTLIHGSIESPLHLLDMLAALHPTAAVAGFPHAKAAQFIYHHESFERGLYAAPIGWVDHQGDGLFAVGIRSAWIEGCRIRLMAGAGIVADSDPDAEVAEVRLKLQSLLQALV